LIKIIHEYYGKLRFVITILAFLSFDIIKAAFDPICFATEMEVTKKWQH